MLRATPLSSRLLLASTLLGSACAQDDEAAPMLDFRGTPSFSAAFCQIDVAGVGEISMEDDYLPHVVACENGGAGFEALQAQAIAARSVAYYAMSTSGQICDGQACQVYTCAHEPTAEVYAAVDATRGQYLSYNDFLTYGFYVAGDPNSSAPSCEGSASIPTEQWVTDNDGAVSTAVQQTPLGFIHDPGDYGYGQNRGCMSQWGARCLESDGADHQEILRHYYGADIEIRQAVGACTSQSCAQCSYADLPPTHPAHEDAEALRDEGALYGCATGSFCPDQPLTRAELAWALAELVGDGSGGSASFTDVAQNHWAADAISSVTTQGIIAPCAAQRFCPNDAISRAAAATFVGRALDLAPASGGAPTFADVPSTHWAFGRIERAQEDGWFTPCDASPLRFCPSSATTRAQAAMLLGEAFGL